MRNTRPLAALCRRHGVKLIDLAMAIGRPYSTVKKWGGEVEIPPEAFPLIIKFFGGAVRPHDLRPRMFGNIDGPSASRSVGKAKLCEIKADRKYAYGRTDDSVRKSNAS